MFKKQDPYSFTQYWTLYNESTVDGGNTSFVSIGVLAVDYHVMLYNDVQVTSQSSVSQPLNQQFMVHCTQRIYLKNPSNTSSSPMGDTSGEAFANYPAIIRTTVNIEKADGLTLNLLDYSPMTVNTAVQTSNSSGASSGSSTSVSSSSTTGSSYSQSSTYGVSVTAGDTFSGATVSYEHAATSTTDKSKSRANESGKSSTVEGSSSAAMSIKDWGSYASVNPLSSAPTWVFGQEFPWSTIRCRYCNDGGVNQNNPSQVEMYISTSMQDALYDGTFLYPPSELSMYGLNFVTKSTWRTYVDYNSSTSITFDHSVKYYSASHMLSSGKVMVYLDSVPSTLYVKDDDGAYITPSVTVDLNIMGLDILGHSLTDAIVGFSASKFIPPVIATESGTSLPENFKIISSTNDLLVEDTTNYAQGSISSFTVSQTSLTAKWPSSGQPSYQLTMYFKVTDSVDEYTLYMKHWKADSNGNGIKLTFVINSDTTNSIVKYVDAFEGEGGDNNLIAIALRNLDFTSIDCHDYLQLGLNSIVVTMEPIDPTLTCTYQLRALSVSRRE